MNDVMSLEKKNNSIGMKASHINWPPQLTLGCNTQPGLRDGILGGMPVHRMMEMPRKLALEKYTFVLWPVSTHMGPQAIGTCFRAARVMR